METTAYDFLLRYDFEDLRRRIYAQTAEDVERALTEAYRTTEDFIALVSPAAVPYLEVMAREAHRLTIERYGKTLQLYLPLYLSNICSNSCVYCGFSKENKIRRRQLTLSEIDREVEAIKRLGFRHLLLVSGEDLRSSSWQYYLEVVKHLRPHFAQLSLEVQPLSTEQYHALGSAGISYVCVYQETYHEAHYPHYHLAGKKADYRYRLETPDRIAQAGIEKIGLGALLGLEEWRTDSTFTALHLSYLKRKYRQTRYSISLPRLRPAVGAYEPSCPIDDLGLVQLILAFRLLDPHVEISLSTRESETLRNHVLPLGITSMSAGSHTEPGGYAEQHADLEQFSINDSRSPEEFVAYLRSVGYEPIWKDWDTWM